jgi:serine/threonine protein kinase
LFKDVDHQHVLLADFGTSELVAGPTDNKMDAVGTPFYMAPEVLTCLSDEEEEQDDDDDLESESESESDAEEEEKEARKAKLSLNGFNKLADMWSIGILTYQLLHGKRINIKMINN